MRRKPLVIAGARYARVDDLRWRYRWADGSVAFDKVRLLLQDRNGNPPPNHRAKDYAYDVADPDYPGEMIPSAGGLSAAQHGLLYRLPDVLRAMAAGEAVYWAEGERDTDTLAMFGWCGTSHHQGAAQAKLAQAEVLRHAARVVLLMDRDEAGLCCVMQRYDLLTRLPVDGGVGIPNERVEIRCVPGAGVGPLGLYSQALNDISDYLGSTELTQAERLRRARRLRRLAPIQLRPLAVEAAGSLSATRAGKGYPSPPGGWSQWRDSLRATGAES